MDDKAIIELFHDRDEQAIIEVSKKYGDFSFSMARHILPEEDAKECVNDIWLQLWDTIPPIYPLNLKAYLAKITRNLAFNRYRALQAKKRGGGEIDLVLEELSTVLPAQETVESIYNHREMEHFLQEFVQNLPARNRVIFIRRYFYADTIRDIAVRCSMTEKHVHVVLNRIRRKLKQALIKEGFTV